MHHPIFPNALSRKLLSIFLLCFAPTVSPTFGQNTVGIGTETPNPRAVLHLVAGDNRPQGLLIPALSTADRTNEGFVGGLSAVENGLLVFDANLRQFYYWMDTTWAPIVSGQVGGDVFGPLANLQLDSGVVELENMADNSVYSATVVDNSITPDDLESPGANKVLISTNAGTVFWENLNSFETVSLAQGFVYVGSTSNEPVEVDMRGSGNLLVGNGTTATSVRVSGDVSLSSEGVVELASERIIDADVSPEAGIAVAKLQPLPVGSIVFGNAAGVATPGTLGGDATINENGELVLADRPQTRANLGLDQSDVTITGGTINGTTVGGEVPAGGSFTEISGSGSGITDLDAGNVATGTLDEARLPDVTAAAIVYGDADQNNPLTSVTVDAKGRVTDASVGTPSDRRLKRDWVPLTGSMAELNRIVPYTYYWKEGSPARQLGVMAQDVEAVFPELVHTRADGYRTVNYSGFVPLLLNALQEQQDTINRLQKQLAAQAQEQAAMRAEWAKIKQLLGESPGE